MRFGIIGTRLITDMLLEAAAGVPGFELTAVYSRNLAHAKEYAAKQGGALAFDDLDAFAQSDAFDAVYVASPNHCHCPQSVKLLRAKKHVLCEKPIASNSQEFAQMRRASEESGCLLLEAVRPLFSPFFQQMRGLLPQLGTLRRASLVYNQYSSRYDKFKQGIVENAFNPAFSNGALMDIGVYCIQLMVGLWSQPDSISAHAVKLDNGLDGQGFILARYSGMLAELSYSKITDCLADSTIQGEAGSLVFSPMVTPKHMRLCLRGQEPQDIPLHDAENNMVYELERFIEWAETPEKAAPYLACSQAAIAVMDEARRQQDIVFPADSAG